MYPWVTTNLFQSLSIACTQALPKLNSGREYQLYIGYWKLFEILTMRFFTELEQKVLWESPKLTVPCAFSCLESTISKAPVFNECFKKERLKEIHKLPCFSEACYTYPAKFCWEEKMMVLPLALIFMKGATLFLFHCSKNSLILVTLAVPWPFIRVANNCSVLFCRILKWMNEWMNELYQGLIKDSCLLFLPHKTYLAFKVSAHNPNAPGQVELVLFWNSLALMCPQQLVINWYKNINYYYY